MKRIMHRNNTISTILVGLMLSPTAIKLSNIYVPRLVRGIQRSLASTGFCGQAAERRPVFLDIILLNLMAVMLSLLASCTVGPNYAPPIIKAPAKWSTSLGSTKVVTNKSSPQNTWWKSFHDPVLNQLIAMSVANNLDLKISKTRILQARANQLNAFAKLFPDIGANVVAARIQPGFITLNREFGLVQGDFDASWELDLFGGKRRKLEAERDFVAVNIEEKNDVLISLVAEVASNYIEVRKNQRLMQVTQKNIQAANSNFMMTRSLQRAGISNELDVTQARSQYQNFESEISLQQIALIAAKNRLTTLLGLFPGSLDKLLATHSPVIPGFDEPVLLATPADVIRQRPDIRKAERNLAGQTALIGEAVAQLFPDVSLGGFYGKQSTTLIPGSEIWGIVPRVYIPLLNFGRVQSQINLAKAHECEAFFQYKKAILSALEDVENQISNYVNIKQRKQFLRQSTSSNQLALHFSLERYKKGLSAFNNVTQSESLLFQAQSAEIIAASEQSKRVIAIYKSLGLHPCNHCH